MSDKKDSQKFTATIGNDKYTVDNKNFVKLQGSAPTNKKTEEKK
jgi:hypothetical protein